MITDLSLLVSAGSGLAQKQKLTEGELRQHIFIDNHVEAVRRLDLEEPIPLDLPHAEQIERLYRYAYIGEANHAAAALYGFNTPEETVGFRLDAAMPRDLPTSIPMLMHAIESNYRLKNLESIEQDRHGNRKVFLNNLFGETANGKLLRIWGAAKDLTCQRQLEEEIRLRSAMFEQVPEGCVIVEAGSQKNIYLNAAFSHITGYTAADLHGNKLSILQGTDTDLDTVSQMREAIAHEQAFIGEILNYKKDGTPFWNLMRLSPIRDSDGIVTHYVGILSDITEQKRIQQNQHSQYVQLAHIARVAVMGEFTAALAHELIQPLAAILSNAQAAQRFLDQAQPDVDEVRDILKSIVADDKRAGEVIHRIRRQVKGDSGHIERLAINPLIEDVYGLVHQDLTIKGVRFGMHLAPDLAMVEGDSVQLQQVILNLILNACQALNKQDAQERRIVLATACRDNQVIEIAVADSGPGIDEALLERIFEPFYTTKKAGLGMGLAINRTIVETHGGRLWAENRSGEGAVFYLTLPIAQRMA
ncbi:MAG: PAS domain S-box protein [Candidatus Thiodiazotropha sp. (ex Epidulcina cf. delphinae)]|nr:PAS domain S-box protein [Candidatus Thiodiazotropha sp. (ex Epidulcina cf. delphinae)]